jgi:hypothetical protein
MRSPKTTVGSVCLWLPRLLLGVRACFDFVRDNEILSRTGATHRKRTLGVRGLLSFFNKRIFPYYPNSALHARSRLFMVTLMGQSC